MTVTEIANFMKKCGPGWDKELANCANFDRTLSKQISEFPYSKVFDYLKKKDYQLNLSDEAEVTLKTFSEDVQLRLEELSYVLSYNPDLKKKSLTDAYFDISHVGGAWCDVELDLYSSKGKVYWLFCKRHLFYTVRPKKVICCQDKKSLYSFLNGKTEGIKYHSILDSEEIN